MKKVTYDPAKRAQTLKERGPDFRDCPEVFAGPTVDIPDKRHDYGEPRTITVGFLLGRMVVVVWTLRDGMRRIIPMRKANDREKAHFEKQLGES
jgi:uncharacterized protein